MYWFKACSPEASTLSCPGFCSNCHHLVGCQLRHESQHRQLCGHHFYSHPLNVALQIGQHLCSFTPYSHEVLTIVSSVSCIPLTQERNFNHVCLMQCIVHWQKFECSNYHLPSFTEDMLTLPTLHNMELFCILVSTWRIFSDSSSHTCPSSHYNCSCF